MDSRNVFDKIALGIISRLESMDDVLNVDFTYGEPAQSHNIAQWERRNIPYRLPEDMKALLSLFNGFSLIWRVEISGRVVPLGNIMLHNINDINKIDIVGNIINDKNLSKENSAAFLIHSCPEYGNICLLYRSNNNSNNDTDNFSIPEIWYQDHLANWHFICNTFTQLMRIMVVHLGISGWQLAFTPEGLPLIARQWMNLFCKERLTIDLLAHEGPLR
jgi:hypothetical protein